MTYFPVPRSAKELADIMGAYNDKVYGSKAPERFAKVAAYNLCIPLVQHEDQSIETATVNMLMDIGSILNFTYYRQYYDEFSFDGVEAGIDPKVMLMRSFWTILEFFRENALGVHTDEAYKFGVKKLHHACIEAFEVLSHGGSLNLLHEAVMPVFEE